MKLSVRSPSVKSIKEALQFKIDTFPNTSKGYNQSIPYRLALNEIEDELTNRKRKHTSPAKKE